MADEINPRAFRTYDPHARDKSSGADPHGSDPLAELARLIGQSNPSADLGGARRNAGEPERRTDAARPPHQPYDTFDSFEETHVDHPGRADNARFDYPDMPRTGIRGNDRPLPVEEEYDRSYYERHAYDDRPFEDRPDVYQNNYNEPMYSGAPQEEMGYESDPYYDENAGAEDDEMYDEAPRPRRRLAKVVAVAALAVIGTGGAFAYRTVFSGGPKTPPVIKAEAGPNKIIPASQSDGQSGKLIYDRLGDNGQGEKMVSREEQPADVASAAQPAQSGPRIVFPPLITNGQPATSAAAEPPSASSPFPPPVVSGNEPKKVRTVTIHPEGADPFARANPPATRTASAASAPAPMPARSAAPTSGNAPLSLVPQNGSSSESTRGVTTASLASASAHAASAHTAPAHRAAPAGSFNVQLLAQKTEEEAQTSFRALQAKYPNILGGREPIFKRKDLGDKGIFYGAQVGPFASREEANQLCDNLKSQGGSCLVQKN